MPQTMLQRRLSDPVRSLDTFRPESVKAGLPSDDIGPNFNTVEHAAILAHYGSVKATAYALGEGAGKSKLDESLMQREFKAGNFSRFGEHADPQAKAVVAEAMVIAFGALTNPRDFALRALDTIEKEVKELRQFVLEQAS